MTAMHVRFLRLTCPKSPAGPPIYRALSLVDDRFVANVHGPDLHVLDLERGDGAEPLLVLEDTGNHAFASNTLVTYDEARGFRRFVREGERFVEASRFVFPERPAPWPTHLVLSPSGRFLCFELMPAPGVKGCRVVLMDATRGEVLAVHERHLSARASFSWLDGAEVLFLSATSYMDVRLLDAASGRTLQSYEATESWDFCHTNYELSADGERLLAFGCVWAAPYEVRLYDARPWTRGTEAKSEGFPLPRLYRQNEDLQYETVFRARFVPTRDGLFDVLSFVDLQALQELEPDDVRDLEEGLSETNLTILAAARGIRAETALLQRRVDPRTGKVVSFRLVPSWETDEPHVHILPDHRAIVIRNGIQWFDGEEMHDVASFEAPRGWFESAVTQDGKTVVVRELVETKSQ
ncbi:hypothetical protein [Polyangium sp. y55x31]|uniref:hypothetical protein n=1 Tax=Polyangium sp. y55x31 TaxID=3042688 RepID=UPI002482B451|nr:hypothetical protein [Polyangium sp. y55x31]MDI1480267.1 hypothetical protein [Polyangium sp. y55x31]